MVFAQPIERVVDEKIPHRTAFRAIEIDSIPPRSVVAIGKELRRIRIQVIALRPEVVVDNIEQDHDPAAMSILNEVLEIFRPAVAAIGSKREDSVITPVAFSGE